MNKEALQALAKEVIKKIDFGTLVRNASKQVEKEGAKEVGNHPGFIVPAYLLVFGIWSAAASYDYISSKRGTMGRARRRGMWHLCILLLPMIYMVADMTFHANANDFKEMSTGLLALLFAFADFSCTVVGLWQLHVFRYRIVASIRSLQSLG